MEKYPNGKIVILEINHSTIFGEITGCFDAFPSDLAYWAQYGNPPIVSLFSESTLDRWNKSAGDTSILDCTTTNLHTWVEYVGFTDIYDYCKHCGKKKDE